MDQQGTTEDLLDFYIDKTYQSFYDSGKQLGKAFLTYLLLICLTALLTYGKVGDGKISVPLLQVSIEKTYAAAATLLLGCVALYWFSITLLHYILLQQKLREFLYRKYQDYKSDWHIGYPSPLDSIWRLADSTNSAIVEWSASIFFIALGISSYILPLFFAWHIANILGLSLLLKISLCLGLVVLLIPTATLMWFAISGYRIYEAVEYLDGLDIRELNIWQIGHPK